MFQVTSLLAGADAAAAAPPPPDAAALEALRAAASAAGGEVKAAKEAAKAGGEEGAVKAALASLADAKAALSAAELRARSVGGLPRTPSGAVDYGKDFFGQKAFLTVSGQLQAEIYACALSSVYTFGPTFRAEDSHTSRHLAEFWMIEPELAFATLEDDMNCAEDYVRHCCAALLERCLPDMEFLAKMYDRECVARMRAVVAQPFARITYTEAVETLLAAKASGAACFEFPVAWGEDLKSEHERYLAEKVYQRPVIVYNYPKGIKAFYMRLNEDGKTVAAMDVLVPGVGELVGGSQREERLDVLTARLQEAGLSPETYSWYLDLRRFGTVPHAGFGLGFERLILFATGLENIRDVIPFPRWGAFFLRPSPALTRPQRARFSANYNCPGASCIQRHDASRKASPTPLPGARCARTHHPPPSPAAAPRAGAIARRSHPPRAPPPHSQPPPACPPRPAATRAVCRRRPRTPAGCPAEQGGQATIPTRRLAGCAPPRPVPRAPAPPTRPQPRC